MTDPIFCHLRFLNTEGKRSIPTLSGPPSDWLIKECLNVSRRYH